MLSDCPALFLLTPRITPSTMNEPKTDTEPRRDPYRSPCEGCIHFKGFFTYNCHIPPPVGKRRPLLRAAILFGALGLALTSELTLTLAHAKTRIAELDFRWMLRTAQSALADFFAPLL